MISTCCPTTICEGDSVILSSSPGSAYLWSNGATTSSIVVYESGVFTVTVTDAMGNQTTSDPVAVTVNPLPSGSVSPTGPITICKGESTVITASGGVSYIWSNGATTASIEVDKQGDYYVQITNEFGCSVTIGPVTVIVNPKPLAVITAGDCNFCEGGSVTLTASTGASYLWSTGETTQSIVVTESGDYDVTVTNSYGCSRTSVPTTVTVYPNPTPIIVPSGPTEFCEGGSVTLTASAAASYLWSNGATTQSITVSDAGCYTVTVTSDNGCVGSAEICVTVNPNPECWIEGVLEFCEGTCTTLTAPSGYSYLWNTGATSQSIEVCAAGSYSVTITDANGCSSTCEVYVTEIPRPEAWVEGELSFCEGGSTTLTAYPDGYTYQWGIPGSGIFYTGQSIVITEGGTYAVHLLSEDGCGTDPSGFVVVVTEYPNPECWIEGVLEICEGACTTLSAPSGYSYVWNTGETSQSIVVCAGGVYTVTITDANGCSSTCEVEVTVNPNPVCSIEGELSFCEGACTTLSAPAGYTYVWNNGATSQSIEVCEPGYYSVTITDANGCSSTCEVYVTEIPRPEAWVEGELSFCEGGSTTLTAYPDGYTYQWGIPGSGIFYTGQSIVITEGGTYAVHLLSEDGCGTDPSGFVVVVTEYPNPECW
ncbi:MAG: hypothetical protein ACK4IY_02285, partial [Chitinophagales bacterium]